jgi:hypothetical protein
MKLLQSANDAVDLAHPHLAEFLDYRFSRSGMPTGTTTCEAAGSILSAGLALASPPLTELKELT